MIWILFAFLSATFTSLRHLYIKKYCPAIPSEILIFITRLLGALVYCPFLIKNQITINPAEMFWGVLIWTVVLTAGATIVQIRIIQTEDISMSAPFLSFIPLLMIPWGMLLLKEYPPAMAWIGLILGSTGAWIIQQTGQSASFRFKNISANVVFLMFGVALTLALTTTCDKIAIDASSAIIYAGFWTLASTGLMFILSLRYSIDQIRKVLKNRHVFIQALFWAVAFASQLFAVQKVSIMSGVVYVKMLTMLHILISVGLGGYHFKESHVAKRLAAAGLMVAGAGLTVWAGFGN